MHPYTQRAVEVFKAGGVVIFPTDTVWGIGAFVGSDVGIEKLYSLKQRDSSKPTALLIGSLSQAFEYGEFSVKQQMAVDRFWPGGLTVVVHTKKSLPQQILNANGCVGLRWPESTFIQEVTHQLNGGIVTASANVAGGLTPITLADIEEDLLHQANLLVDEARVLTGIASTVVDLTGQTPRIIRQGNVIYRED